MWPLELNAREAETVEECEVVLDGEMLKPGSSLLYSSIFRSTISRCYQAARSFEHRITHVKTISCPTGESPPALIDLPPIILDWQLINSGFLSVRYR